MVAAATMLSRPLLLLLAAASIVGTARAAPTLVFILAGQSNMGGRGGATNGTWDGIVPPECAPSPRVLRLSPDLRWEEAREPLHAGIDVHNVLGVGPGMPFANAVRASPAVPHGTVIGLVPCAQGATPIANWSRGTDLYDRMLTRAKVALAECAGDGKLAAMLWYQGEADTIRRDDAEVYTARMEAMVRDVRRDLAMPDLLVIQVGIATGQGKFIELVRKAQRAVKLRNVKYVDAKGLPIASDYTHLTTQAQVPKVANDGADELKYYDALLHDMSEPLRKGISIRTILQVPEDRHRRIWHGDHVRDRDAIARSGLFESVHNSKTTKIARSLKSM